MKTAVSLFLFSILVLAQSFQGSLRGRVVDPNGAATPAAKITLTDEATSGARSTISNDQGVYDFFAIVPATYTVEVEAPGFRRLERKGVVVSTQANVTLDLSLEIGQISSQVNVTAEAPSLDAADATTGQLIDNQKITDLPLLGRNPYFEGQLAQGVVYAANPEFHRMQDQNGNSQVSIAGGPLRTNNYLIDGISITDSNNRAVIVPSPEAVQELKLQTSEYDAEVSRTGGGTFNVLINSGTNALHGSAVGHIRETDWLANNFFANLHGQPRPDSPFKDFAFSLGGPVVIPHLYNGRNRTFFFASYEAYRETDGSTTTLAVPTALEVKGDFSRTFNKNGSQQIIYDPLSTNLSTGARTPFPGNVIPLSAQNPVGQALASYYPTAAASYYAQQNYNFTGSYPNRGDQALFKLDHEFANWIRASGSYIHQKTFEVDYPENIFPNAGTPNQIFCCDRKIDAVAGNATLTPNATTVITARWGFNRFYSKSTPQSLGFDLSSLGLPQSLVNATPNPAFPAITMSDYASFGGGTTNQDVFYSRSFNVTAAHYIGRHTLRAGFDFRTIHDFGTPASGPSSFTFSSAFTQANPLVSNGLSGSSLASLLLGYPASGSQSVVSQFDDYIRYYGGFIQDDFRLTPKLTLNFGLRLEHESGLSEEQNRLIVGFNGSAASPLAQPDFPLTGGVEYAGVGGNPTHTGNPLSVKFAPRAGFAYSVTPKTVIRGGYGIYWAPTFFSYQNAIGYSQTTSIVASTNGNYTPAVSLSNPYPNGLLQPTGNALGLASGVGQAIGIFSPTASSAGYSQHYSIEVQQELPQHFVVSAGVLGSHNLHLLENGINIDQLNPSYFSLGASTLTQAVPNPLYGNGGVGTVGTPTVSRLQLLLPYPQFTSVSVSNSNTASSVYYSFYIRAERRFSQGIGVLASYTWSRSEDNITGLNTAGSSNIAAVTGPQNGYNPNAEWSLSTQDVPNRFTMSATYDLPFGKGKKFLNGSTVLDWIAGSWSLNTLGIVQSGFPLAITQANANSVVGASYQRPNATGVSPLTQGSIDARLTGWLNPAAFSVTPALGFGNISRFIDVRGPGLFNIDFSIFKSFTIRERLKAQFRAEALNLTNTPYFGNPGTVVTSTASFGQITSQINYARLVQLGFRATF
ncbi:MAG TPA: TonB-dependent receptor [Bryobacteraceae bacterium]|nr:TonB-dependent receptor [Bryobacteraceae bacterium]